LRSGKSDGFDLISIEIYDEGAEIGCDCSRALGRSTLVFWRQGLLLEHERLLLLPYWARAGKYVRQDYQCPVHDAAGC
jgi:hypothetical protein